MGYTHYWQAKQIEPSIFAMLSQQVAAAAEIARTQEIVEVAYEMDQTDRPPEFNGEVIRFNGKDDDGHETFMLAYDDSGFRYCKTAQKPYDIVVVAALCLLAHHADPEVTSDGGLEDWEGGLALAREVEPDCKMPPAIEG